MIKKTLLATLMVAALMGATAPLANAHAGEVEGYSVLDLGTTYYLETESENGEHFVLLVQETNLVFENGVVVEDEDTGAQIHDACILPDVNLESVYVSRAEPRYNYVIAQAEEVPFDDHEDIEDATAFWATHGIDIADHEAVHDACEALGGSFVHADTLLLHEGHEH